MPINIGPKIGVDGEAAFRNEIKNIAQQLKVLDSEMKIVTNSFKNNGDEQLPISFTVREDPHKHRKTAGDAEKTDRCTEKRH